MTERWEAHGIACMIRKAPRFVRPPLFGRRQDNGYVGVPPNHPWHGKHYGLIDTDIHGGLTFSGEWDDAPGLWWLGFDDQHLGKLTRPLRDEVENLARQAAEAIKKPEIRE